MIQLTFYRKERKQNCCRTICNMVHIPFWDFDLLAVLCIFISYFFILPQKSTTEIYVSIQILLLYFSLQASVNNAGAQRNCIFFSSIPECMTYGKGESGKGRAIVNVPRCLVDLSGRIASPIPSVFVYRSKGMWR